MFTTINMRTLTRAIMELSIIRSLFGGIETNGQPQIEKLVFRYNDGMRTEIEVPCTRCTVEIHFQK